MPGSCIGICRRRPKALSLRARLQDARTSASLIGRSRARPGCWPRGGYLPVGIEPWAACTLVTLQGYLGKQIGTGRLPGRRPRERAKLTRAAGEHQTRGLAVPPKSPGDRVLGRTRWIFPGPPHQRWWVRKIATAPIKDPTLMPPTVKTDRCEIWQAETRRCGHSDQHLCRQAKCQDREGGEQGRAHRQSIAAPAPLA
jgi:hypothetical protein